MLSSAAPDNVPMSNDAPPATSFLTALPLRARAPRILWSDADTARGARAQRALAGLADVEIVPGAKAALTALRASEPDLVVCAADPGAVELIAALDEKRFATLPLVLLAAGANAPAHPRAADVLREPLPDRELAARIGAQLEILRLRRALAEKESESETWFRLALRASGLGVWHSRLSSGELSIDANLAEMFGLPAEPTTLKDSEWLARIHPEDRPRVIAELQARRQDLKPLEIDFRTVLPDGSFRSLAVMGGVIRHGGDTPETGVAYRSVGVARDVTDRVRDAERQQLLLAELNHRVRNTLASVLALAQQTAQDAVSVPAFLATFRARVMALAAAHNLLTRGKWQSAPLRDLVEAILAPERTAARGRVEIAGPACELPPPKVLAMTLGLHELATNARKYGALSAVEGRLSITWTVAHVEGERRLTLSWVERRGPPVAPPTRIGFGTRLLRRALGPDLDGTVRLDFDRPGLSCTIEFPLPRTP